MSSEQTKWWKKPPYSNIVGGLTVAFVIWIVSTVYKLITAPLIILSFKGIMTFAFNNFIFLFNYELKLWWLLIIGIFIYIMKIIYGYIYTKKNVINPIPTEVREMLAYKKDKFGHNFWGWNWKIHPITETYEVTDLYLMCNTEGCNYSPVTGRRYDTEHGDHNYFCKGCRKCYSDIDESEIVSFIEGKYSIRDQKIII